MGFVGVIAVLILSACVTGAPRLSEEQEEHVASITLFPIGQQPDRPYKILGVIESADCSGDPWHGRTYGNADRALDTLKRKAARRLLLNARLQRDGGDLVVPEQIVVGISWCAG